MELQVFWRNRNTENIQGIQSKKNIRIGKHSPIAILL